MQTSALRFKWQEYEWGAMIPFVLLHAACVVVFWIPFQLTAGNDVHSMGRVGSGKERDPCL